MKTQSEQGRAEETKIPYPAKYKVEYEWLKEIDSLALANAQLNLQTAYKNFLVVKVSFLHSKIKRVENPIQRIE